MIFVTVGTHEQPFNRLIQKVDELKGDGVFSDEVIMQTGFSDYHPRNCKYKDFISHDDMQRYVDGARVVITHGGPSSFIMPLQVHKIPIVVPRLKEFDEHVNDHQLDFARQVANRKKNILVVEDIDKLADVIVNYDSEVAKLNGNIDSNNKRFNKTLEKIVNGLF